jgi:hypothetical protein
MTDWSKFYVREVGPTTNMYAMFYSLATAFTKLGARNEHTWNTFYGLIILIE